MMLTAFAHFLLASALLQMLPVDVLDLETRALAKKPGSPISVHDVFSLSQARLPVANNVAAAPKKQKENSIGVVTSAVSALVLDRASGAVLFQKNIQEPRSIGSITKLMTAHVFLQSGVHLDEKVTLLVEDLRFGGEQHLTINEAFTIRDLLYASLVSSDNTATAALARLSNLSAGDFVTRMNEEAAAIGMEQTHFVDPTGLSSKNQSVVQDIARLLDEVAKQDLLRTITQTSMISIRGGSGRVYQLSSTDALLTSFVNKPPFRIEAGKTGYLPEAGYCLGTLFSHISKDEIIVVVLGAQTEVGRFQDVKALAAWAYDTYQWES